MLAPRPTRRRNPLALCALAVLASVAPAADYFPPTNDNWQTITATEAGANAEQLADAVTFAGENHSNALVVLSQGKILVESYWNGWTRSTTGPSYSAAKSVAAVLVGQAIAQGHIDSIDQPSSDFLREWRGDPARQGILIRHHLAMTTGFQESPLTLLLLHQAKSERFFGTQQPIEYPPGTRWNYNDAAYRLLFYIIEEAANETLPEFSQRSLFGPIGMNATTWVNRQEQLLGATIDNYQWLDFPALDAARFGLLALRKGSWNGAQLVSADWINQSATAQHPFAPTYGRLWWLNASPVHELPGEHRQRSGPIAPDAPPDTFAALGALDQKIWVVPSLDLVVVRLGTEASEGTLAAGIFDNLLLGRICRAFGYQGQAQPTTTSISRPSNTLQIQIDTWNGRRYSLHHSTDLQDWTPSEALQNHEGDGLPILINRPSNQTEFFQATSRFPAAE